MCVYSDGYVHNKMFVELYIYLYVFICLFIFVFAYGSKTKALQATSKLSTERKPRQRPNRTATAS